MCKIYRISLKIFKEYCLTWNSLQHLSPKSNTNKQPQRKCKRAHHKNSKHFSNNVQSKNEQGSKNQIDAK